MGECKVHTERTLSLLSKYINETNIMKEDIVGVYPVSDGYIIMYYQWKRKEN
jgi:uncharacterized membrane protein (Fun14 family)